MGVFKRLDLLTTRAKGRYLDNIGRMYGMVRKKRTVFFGIFTIRESDRDFRKRIKNKVRGGF